MANPGLPTSKPDLGNKQSEAALMNLCTIISRIEETIEIETALISTDIHFDIRTSNIRKSRYFYEFSKAIAGLDEFALPQEQQDAIIRFREKLAANETAILAHLNAVSEITTLIQDAIQTAETDGTYTASEFVRVTKSI